MPREEAREHHFLPQFLLRPWSVEGLLRGYWWDRRRGALVCKHRGTKAFCWQLDLLSLRAHNLGRDAIERVFFGDIDTRGAVARDTMLEFGSSKLTNDQRCDFARLLLSLDARRPANIAKLRDEGFAALVGGLDGDAEIRDAMSAHRIIERPSAFYERTTGAFIEDRALVAIQRLVDNPEVGGRLVKAHWHVVHLGPFDGSFVLADRPLIRTHGYDHPGTVWVLPLTPTTAFVAANHPENLERIKRATPRRFGKLTNRSSAGQAERFVFSADTSHEHWLSGCLSETRG